MFSVLSWIRPSDAQAPIANDASKVPDANNVPAATAASSGTEGQQQDDWVFLPSDHDDLMESSISDLDLLSASMTLYRPSVHPASSRTRATADHDLTSTEEGGEEAVVPQMKSKRQLKQERRQQQALAELERKPRYDPMIAKMRDQEFKMAKLAKMGLRNGRVMSSSTGGPNSSSARSTRSSGSGSGSNNSTSGGSTSGPQQSSVATEVC
ncbi:hypothetical protein BGZ65_002847 [Modicella reniformis]|uniref:Uncharacterized protein n=1 Tax=Modicella reniformis TaxID=1440133 RepID=A0A9P6ILW4_9FUNG|nr:hypothetical protein BGZ65_002847 [Modicella reniformis]